jgi:hypothetical protein
MKKVDRQQAGCHRDRAESFRAGMNLLADDLSSYGNAVALLAVHTAISIADAVLVACTGERSNERDHRSVLRPLRALCGFRRKDQAGIKHFAWLISQKTDFAYGDRRLNLENDVKLARVKAERFIAWAYLSFPEIGPTEE